MSGATALVPSQVVRAWLAFAYIALLYAVVVAIAAFFIWLAFIDYGRDLNPAAVMRIYPLMVAALLLWAIRPRRDVFEATGFKIEQSDQPEIFAIFREVAVACRQRLPDAIYLEPEVVAQAGYRGGVAGIGSRSMMGIGLPLLATLTVDQLKSVIAHEFAHLAVDASPVVRFVTRLHRTATEALAVNDRSLGGLMRRAVFGPFLAIAGDLSQSLERTADEMAAHAVSPEDMAAALARIQESESPYLHYIITNLEPALDAGIHPPITAGFAQYMNRPFQRESGQIWARMSDVVEAYRDGSHPPTALRIATMNLRTGGVDRARDDQPAFLTVRDLSGVEAGAYSWRGESLHAMRSVSWAETVAAVHAPSWRKTVERYRAALEGCRIDALPDREEMVKLARLVREPMIKLADDDEVVRNGTAAFASAICLKLHALGWRAPDQPLESPEFFKDDVRVQPFRLLGELEPNNRQDWADFCRQTGLTGLLLQPATSPRE